MSNISSWSTSAASNNSSPPDGWPEGMAPSAVNDSARENMAAVRRWYNDAEWIDWGHTPVRQSANSFLVSLTATLVYTPGRRLRMYDATTIYGEVLSSGLSGANTLVTVSSSALTSSLSSLSVHIIEPNNLGLPSPSALRAETSWVMLVLGTETDTSTGATSYDYTSIPSWVRRITLHFVGVAISGTANILIRLGDSGGIESTGYVGCGSYISGDSGLGTDAQRVTSVTNGFLIEKTAATETLHGNVVLTLEDSSDNTWTCSGTLADDTNGAIFSVSGSKALSATLDRLRIISSNGADTFTAGVVNITYE